MRIGVAEARAGTPRARLRRASTSRNPADARRAARSVPRSVRETSEVGALEDDAEASSSRRAPASFSGDRLEVSDDASLLARLEAVTARVFDAVSPDVDALVPERRPPRLSRLVRVVGAVPEIDWAEATRTEARFADLARTFAGYEGHAREPVILRGAADAWPCVSDPQKRWTLANLTRRHGGFAGETRVRDGDASRAMRLAASEFQYVEANHPAVRAGTFQSPSTVRGMTVSEVAARMTARDGDDDSAGAYMQAELRGALVSEAGMILSRDDSNDGDSNDSNDSNDKTSFWSLCDAAGWRETQPPRLWLSQAGSTSSLHYDSSVSVLAQAHGLKRMLLYPPSALARAALYPDWHPLRRRSAVRLDADFANGDATAANEAFPRWAGEEGRRRDDRRTDKWSGDVGADATTRAAAGKPAGKNDTKNKDAFAFAFADGPFTTPPGAWEAVLAPGDVLVFPPRWAHYTESLGPRVSSSVTRRFASPPLAAAVVLAEEWRALVGFASGEDDADNDADTTPPGDADAKAAAVRFARWRVRAGGPSPGARALEQLARAGVARALSRNSLRLDPETGAVVPEDTACFVSAFGSGSARARGAPEDQWLAAAEDAARVAVVACEGRSSSEPSEPSEREADVLARVGAGRVAGAYARGSVARGEAKPGKSDIDLVLLCWDDGVTKTSALRDATRAAFSRSSDWTIRWSRLRATKVDVRIQTVPLPPHPAGRALADVLDDVIIIDSGGASESINTSDERIQKSSDERLSALADALGPELAFVLAAESVTLAGADVPSFLPERARVPPPRCLPSLTMDVCEALADGGERSLKWALRRAIRAAFEKEARVTSAFPGSSQEPETRETKTKTKSPCLEYTRDLFLCARFVARRRPELGEDLACALVAAVHGPRAVWGALWYAGGSALARRLTEAVASGND